MNRHGTLVVVDDNKNILTSLQYLLDSYFEQVVTLSSPVTLPTVLQQKRPDVVLLDMNFSSGLNTGNEGLYWLREIKRLRPQTQVVLFTAYADISLAVTGLKDGATDFIVKPWDNAKLVQTLLEALEKAQQGKPKQKPESTPIIYNKESEMYWGESEAIRPLKLTVERVSVTDANILITGENGTGKDMLAHEIHRLSNRSEGPFVSVDMGAITETLFESELFGHVKGSFTDAHADRTGRFEAADGGTLFLDEIANLPLHMQPKLLTAIQKRSYVKVGSNIPQPTNIRLICATNRNLNDMVRSGEFREDLLYRINTIHLHLPALRERKEDILPLAKRFLTLYNGQYGRQLQGISDEAAAKLQAHPWYGNIRELQHTIEKAVIMADGKELKPQHLELNVTAQPEASLQPVMPQEQEPKTLEDTEREAIKRAMDRYEGNMSQVASVLGISRQTLYSKLKRYGI
ncbi:MAG: sigma-54-dependent Fis family transcriptional regulator [Bacteroidaceae bacterium]|nr:sigma-54-dependent Fis family transcriptional regulator [Bacteroidaceae bacterium]